MDKKIITVQTTKPCLILPRPVDASMFWTEPKFQLRKEEKEFLIPSSVLYLWEEFLKSISLIFGLLSSPYLIQLSWWIYELLIVVRFECRLTCFCFVLLTTNVLVSLETANSITSRKQYPKMDTLLDFPHLFAVCCYFVSNKYSTTVHCVANLRGYFDASARKEMHWANLLLKQFYFNWVATEIILGLDP